MKINLLKKTYVLSEEQYRKEKQIFLSSLVAFVVLVAASAALFGWNLILSSQSSRADAEINSTKAKLNSLAKATAKQIYLKDRIKLIQGFFASRVSSREALQQIYSLSIEGVSIAGVSFLDSGEGVSVQLDAQGVTALERAFDYFEKENTFFPQVVNEGVMRNVDGRYTMNLVMSLPFEENKNGSK